MIRSGPTFLIGTCMVLAGAAMARAPEALLDPYRSAGAGPFSVARGSAAWTRENGPEGRSCASCHGSDLTVPGRHRTTGKPIGPLAPSADPRRLSEPREVEKWLFRNCRWTLGRACTPQEKGDFLQYIGSQ
jgi:hypothetical protein